MALTIADLVTSLLDSAVSAGIVNSSADVVAGASPYTLTKVHIALRRALNHLIRQSGCTRRHATVSLVADNQEVDFSSTTGIEPGRLAETKIRLVEDSNYTASKICEPLSIVALSEISRWRALSTSSGVPRILAFTGTSLATDKPVVYPPPQYAGSLSVNYSPLLLAFSGNTVSAWTMGDTAANAYTTNLPDDIADRAAATGGVLYLQRGYIDKAALNAPLGQAFVDLINDSRSVGGYGVESIQPLSLSDLRGRRYL